MKKFAALILALMLVLLSVPSLAEEGSTFIMGFDAEYPPYTYMGDDGVVSEGYMSAKHMMTGSVYWDLDGNGNLVLTPVNTETKYGELPSLGTASDTTDSTPQAAWYPCSTNIVSFKITDGTTVGVTRAGYMNHMFNNCVNMMECNLVGLDTTNA